ncbi:MAG TPA: hypothetical protein VK939_11515 [Longimicrobiales bacterium]|nr:hypothetical protein [Longimicrobiales bacterium]
MKLATYNFQLGGGRDGGRHWQRLEDEIGADVAFAQEASRPPGHSPRRRGGRTVWRRINERSWGSAVAVRGRVLEELSFGALAGWLTGCVAELDEGTTVSAISVHTPTMQGQNYALLLTSVIAEIRRLNLDAPLVLGGDLNVKSAGPRQPGEELGTSAAERAVIARISDELGVVSCWDAANPGSELPQTLRWSRSPEVPYHSDALFVAAGWKVIACEVLQREPWPGMSDHFPVIAEVSPGSGAGTNP